MSFLNILPWVLLAIVSVIGFYKNQPRQLSKLCGKERFVLTGYRSKKYFYVIVHRTFKITVYKHDAEKIFGTENNFGPEMKKGWYGFIPLGNGKIMVSFVK